MALLSSWQPVAANCPISTQLPFSDSKLLLCEPLILYHFCAAQRCDKAKLRVACVTATMQG